MCGGFLLAERARGAGVQNGLAVKQQPGAAALERRDVCR